MILINSSPKDALKIFQPFLPIFVPVGIGFLLSALEEKGVNALYVDEQVEDDTFGKIKELVKGREKPYIFGFSVLTAAFKSSIVLSKKLKDLYPDSIVVFGGTHPTANPDEVLSYDHIDIVVRGEGECILPDLYKCLKAKASYEHIQSISYRKDGKVTHNNKAPILKNLDEYPAFPYHRFVHEKKYDLGFIVSSRGCPYECIFCSNRVTTNKAYRYRSAESVLNELELLSSKYKQKYVLFLDDNFLVNKERISVLAEGIKARGLDKKMSFNFQARGDNVNYELLKILYDANFKSIFFGIETASNRLLKIVKKGETIEEIIDAVKMSKKIGFHVSATFIYGLPTETHKDRVSSMDLSRDLDIDMVRFNNATPYPGTELYEIAKKENKLYVQGLYENFNSVSTFIENPFKKIPFSYIPDGNSEAKIRSDILLSYLLFYLNFKKIKKVFNNPDQGVGWFNAGEKIFEMIRKLPSIITLGFLLSIKFIEFLFNILIGKDTDVSLKYLIKNIIVQKGKL